MPHAREFQRVGDGKKGVYANAKKQLKCMFPNVMGHQCRRYARGVVGHIPACNVHKAKWKVDK
jgi:hypothetical protein